MTVEEVYAILKKQIQSGGATPEQIQQAVDAYLEENPVQPGATVEQVAQIEKNKADISSLSEDKVNNPIDNKYGTSGQFLRTKGNGETEWVDGALPTDDQTNNAVEKWLNKHPEATTTVRDGSIEEVKFSDTLRNRKASYYNSVSKMKADNSLKDGMAAVTLGYYEPNDGGGATYRIRAKLETDIDDGGSIHELNGGQLVAELIIEEYVTPEMFGTVGDGVHDNSDAINEAITYLNEGGGGTLLFTKTKYLCQKTIKVKENVMINSNNSSVIMGDVTGILIEIGNSKKSGLKNISIHGNVNSDIQDTILIHMGSKDEKTDLSGVLIENVRVSNTNGIGIYVEPLTWYYYIQNITFFNCRNSGLLIYGSDTTLNDVKITNCGLGLGIYGSNNKINNCKIIFCGESGKPGFEIKNCFRIYLSNIELQDNYGSAIHIENVKNLHFNSCLCDRNNTINEGDSDITIVKSEYIFGDLSFTNMIYSSTPINISQSKDIHIDGFSGTEDIISDIISKDFILKCVSGEKYVVESKTIPNPTYNSSKFSNIDVSNKQNISFKANSSGARLNFNLSTFEKDNWYTCIVKLNGNGKIYITSLDNSSEGEYITFKDEEIDINGDKIVTLVFYIPENCFRPWIYLEDKSNVFNNVRVTDLMIISTNNEKIARFFYNIHGYIPNGSKDVSIWNLLRS